MSSDVITVLVVNIDFLFACPDFKFLSQIFPWHAIMDFVEGEGEILCYFNNLPFKVFEAIGWKGQKRLLLFCCKEIISGIGESFEGLAVLLVYLFHQDAV